MTNNNLAQPIKNTLLAFISLIIIYAISFYWLDLPAASYMHQLNSNTHFYEGCLILGIIFKSAVWFCLAVLVTIFGCVIHYGAKKPSIAKPYLFFGLSIILAFCLAFVFKNVLGRARPIEYFQHGIYGFHYFTMKYNFTSSPSGHATVAFATAVTLCSLAKNRGFKLFYILMACAVAISRVVITKHYLSDVIFGAYIGSLSVMWVKYFLQRHTRSGNDNARLYTTQV